MSDSAARFLDRVLETLDEANEIGGIDDDLEYIQVMEAIAAAARMRAEMCRQNAGNGGADRTAPEPRKE